MSERISFEKHPMLRDKVPSWWNLAGAEVVLDSRQPSENQVKLINLTDHLNISRQSFTDQIWIISWQLHHPQSIISGLVEMEQADLEAAFGLINTYSRNSLWLINEYGGTCAKEGAFIRWKDYLNIPGPGTHHFKDPNFSILLNEGIKAAVGRLMIHFELDDPDCSKPTFIL